MTNWEEKRKIILARDNYTCHLCKQFNPELGQVELINEVNRDLEFHEYMNHPDPLQSEYTLYESRTGYTYIINFGNCWPVFPIMQVHHKRYINGKERWDYNNEDLITVCKGCHTDLHLNKLIPIYSEDNILLEERMFLPVDTGSGRKHDCDDWTFIQRVGGGEYVVSGITPTITMVVLDGEDSEGAQLAAVNALDNFINLYFPRYSKKK